MIKINTLIVVVVLYKCRIEDSISVKTLSDSILNFGNTFVDLVVYDNSPSYNSNYESLQIKGLNIHYIMDYDNSGVSKAYNVASRLGRELGKKYILLLDQDTKISPLYFLDLSNIDDKYHLVVPKLESKGVGLSPCRYFLGRGSSLKDKEYLEGQKSLKRRNFLNSGSLISLDIFDKTGGFDEKIPLYFSDFNFFNRIKRHINIYYQMKTVFYHDMSSNDESNFDLFLKRFELYCDGATKCYNDFIGHSIMFINVLLRSIKVGLKNRTLIFTKMVIRKFFCN